jgi:hypothetical protein
MMPAAMRPIGFGVLDDESEDEPLASLLPPRSIIRPDFAELAAIAEPAEEVDDSDEPEAGFSSLLEINTAGPIRQNFIRIDEPLAAVDAVEPVVIFPGQAIRSNIEAVQAPASEAETESATPFRRFDAPDNAEAGQPVAAPSMTNHHVEETEQALRAALANLQRMSGAA